MNRRKNILFQLRRRQHCNSVKLNGRNVRRQFLMDRRVAHTVMFIIGKISE
jgi:hypothetical protein